MLGLYKLNFLIPTYIRRALVLSILALCMTWVNSTNAHADPGSTPPRIEQYQVKAVYLYNFLNFVSWPVPQTTSEQPNSKIIGVLGESPLNNALNNLAARLAKRNKTKLKLIFYGKYEAGQDFKACNILFLNKSVKDNFIKIIAQLDHAPILTVSDSKDFIAAGGMVSMFEVQDRIRYSINRKAVIAAGLEAKSQLLNSAVK
jgi:hypothetical protein